MEIRRLVEILLVEDNEGDVEIAMEAFKTSKSRSRVNVVRDGAAALNYLYKRNGYEESKSPDIIFLDLNLPKIDGREVLESVKQDSNLKRIPVIVLTSSIAERDILETYSLHANCYIVKPVDARKFIDILRQAESFWAEIVNLPYMT